MAFKITIERIEQAPEKIRGKYQEVGVRYIDAEEYSKLKANREDGWDRWKRLDNGQYEQPEYGYLKDEETVKNVTTRVFEQTVEELNLKAVITAINSAE